MNSALSAVQLLGKHVDAISGMRIDLKSRLRELRSDKVGWEWQNMRVFVSKLFKDIIVHTIVGEVVQEVNVMSAVKTCQCSCIDALLVTLSSVDAAETTECDELAKPPRATEALYVLNGMKMIAARSQVYMSNWRCQKW